MGEGEVESESESKSKSKARGILRGGAPLIAAPISMAASASSPAEASPPLDSVASDDEWGN
jgi:hypothetical protein